MVRFVRLHVGARKVYGAALPSTCIFTSPTRLIRWSGNLYGGTCREGRGDRCVAAPIGQRERPDGAGESRDQRSVRPVLPAAVADEFCSVGRDNAQFRVGYEPLNAEGRQTGTNRAGKKPFGIGVGNDHSDQQGVFPGTEHRPR